MNNFMKTPILFLLIFIYFFIVILLNVYTILVLKAGLDIPIENAFFIAIFQIPIVLLLIFIPGSGVGGVHYTNQIIIRESLTIIVACVILIAITFFISHIFVSRKEKRLINRKQSNIH